MKFINQEVQITKEQARSLLMKYKNHYLWHKSFKEWNGQGLANLKNGVIEKPKKVIDKDSIKKSGTRHIRYQRVRVIFNDGTTQEFPSVKGVANKFKILQNSVSRILNGTRTTNKFKSITKI